MSTKIYDGVKLQDSNFHDLKKIMEAMKEELIPIAREEYLKVYASVLEKVVVYIQTGYKMMSAIEYDKLTDTSPLEVARFATHTCNDIIRENKKRDLSYDSDFDFEASVWIFPIKDKILACPCITSPEIMKAFMENKAVSEYGYWNNTDKPDRISDEEWETRRIDWDEALPGIGMLSRCGFQYVLVDGILDAYAYISKPDEKVFKYLTPKEKLTCHVAKNMLLEEKLNSLVGDRKTLKSNETVHLYVQARDYVKAHPELVEEKIPSINVDVLAFFASENQ